MSLGATDALSATASSALSANSMANIGVSEEEKPEFILTRDIMVPMRDGVKLAGDLFLPNRDRGEKYPCILIRTPYDKDLEEDKKLQHHDAESSGHYWTTHGYALYIQDCRGRFKSEGEFYKYVGEAEDGFDTVAWIAAQPWSDGNVGTAGSSYLCHVQTSMAVLRPPALKAMFCIKGGFFNAYHSGVRYGGALEFRQWVWTFKTAPKGAEAHRDPLVKKALAGINWAAWLTKGYPFVKGLSPLSVAPSYERFMFDMTEQVCYSPYWRQMGLNTEVYLDQFGDIPTMYLTGWYDIYARSTMDFFRHLSPIKKGPIFIIVGPWGHHAEGHEIGEVDFGRHADLMYLSPHLYDMEMVFFDEHLKGHKRSTVQHPPVRYFRMGGGDGRKTLNGHMMHGGRWFQAEAWPPPASEEVVLYLREDARLSRKTQPCSHPDRVADVALRSSWTIQAFLSSLGLDEYVEKFLTNKIDLPSLLALLLDMNAGLLAELVPPLGDRAKLKAGIDHMISAKSFHRDEATSFKHNPLDPVPSIGGNLFTFGDILLVGPYDQTERADMFLCKEPFLPLHARRDVISFSTKPLPCSVDVSGTVVVTLFVSSSAPDTDFCVKLVDSYPPSEDYPLGFNMNITHGILRCRHRNSWEREDPMIHGEVYEIKVECYPTSNLFQAGHRLRIDIASSNFPHYDINPNTGETFGLSKRWRVAENTVYHSSVYPSAVHLPVVRAAVPLEHRHTEWSKLRGLGPMLRSTSDLKRAATGAASPKASD